MILPLFGMLLVMAGFFYDILFAGIPYQDPTPAMQEQYDFHDFIAGLFYKSGAVIFLIGLVFIPVFWKK